MGGFGLLTEQPQSTPPMESPEGLQARLAEALQQRYASPAPKEEGWTQYPGSLQSVQQPAPDLPSEKTDAEKNANDPLAPLLENLTQRYQALQEPPHRTGVKGFLTNFFQGGGEALMRSQGLETPGDERSKLLTQIFHLSNARVAYQGQLAENELKKAQVAAANRPLSPEQASAIGSPQLAGQVVPSEIVSAASAQQTRLQNAKLAAQERTDNKQNQPTISLPLDANTAKLAGVHEKFVGQALSTADWKLIDAKLDSQGYSRMDMGKDGKDGGIWVVDRGGNRINQVTPVSESARALKSNRDSEIEVAAQALTNPRNLTAIKDIASMRGDQRLRIFARAREIDPNFDPGLVNERIKFLQSYEDPKGRSAINRQAINNILQHAGDLSRVNEEYRRADVKVINTPLNEIARQFGYDTYTKFAATNSVLKDELSLYFAGGYAPTVDQQKMWSKIQSDEAPPSATEAFAKEVAHLGLRRATTFDSQFKKVMGYSDPNMIIPEAKNAAENLGLGSEVAQFGTGGQYGQGQGGKASGGMTVTDPRGVVHTFPNQQAADAFKKAAGIR